MSANAAKMTDCPVCQQQHETMLLHGMEFVPCPRVPKNTLISLPSTRDPLDKEIEIIERTLYNALDRLKKIRASKR